MSVQEFCKLNFYTQKYTKGNVIYETEAVSDTCTERAGKVLY